jgi:hypothetical protein
MPEDQNSTQPSPPTESPQPNTTEARTPDGTLKDQSSLQPAVTNDATKPDAPAPSGAPEKYEFKPAEGKTLDQSAIDAAVPVFKELGLTQAQADKLMNVWNGRIDDLAKENVKYVETMRAEWRDKVSKDPDMAGRLDQIKSDIGQFKATLDPKLRADFEEAMNLTGAGDHPAFVKAFWKMSQSAIEGKHVSGKGPSLNGQTPPNTAAPSLAQQMYPHLPSGRA